jgi:hypothetical protein
MLPEEFIEHSRGFDFGFLVTVERGVPSIEIVDFEARPEHIIIKSRRKTTGKGCLVFANERYSENSIMAQVTGRLINDEDGYKLIPYRAYWTYPFSLDSYPEEIVRRWRRR